MLILFEEQLFFHSLTSVLVIVSYIYIICRRLDVSFNGHFGDEDNIFFTPNVNLKANISELQIGTF